MTGVPRLSLVPRLVAATNEADLSDASARAKELPRRPRVYFEEWDEPMISGLGWVSELITVAGGIDIFANLATEKSAKNRIVSP